MTQAETSQAVELINRYAFGMDTKNFSSASSALSTNVDIDYSAVGGPARRMERTEVATFLSGLLGRDNLKVHTSIGQVFVDPDRDETMIAYYSVRHYRADAQDQKRFVLFGWYEFEVRGQLIDRLVIRVQATEGDASILGS